LPSTADWLNQPGGLAERLQLMRKAAGLTGEELAGQLSWARSKISKLENGRQMPTTADVTAWAGACGQPDSAPELLTLLAEGQAVARQYRHWGGRGHAQIQLDLDTMVRQASVIRNAEALFIPGLLQTAGYARSRMEEAVRMHAFNEAGVDTAVAARLRRQEALYDTGRTFEFIICDAALQVLLCPPEDMAGQLDRLLLVSGLPNVTLGIIPLHKRLSVAPMHGFLIVDEVTFVETHTSELILTGEESAHYARIADGLLAESVTGDEARDLILTAATDLRRPGPPRASPD
jgi:transcriptional regulator with XRE-family HTH domain